jgi:hypothetical protein
VRFLTTKVTGEFSDRFSSRSLRCATGVTRFTAYLDGTSRAPIQSQYVTSGR